MRIRTVEITPEVEDVLRRGEWRGWLFVLPPGQLDRKLYEAVDKVLRALGGKWHRGHKGHMFGMDAKDDLVAALESGAAIDTKRTLEQFFTPSHVASQMADLLGVTSEMRVLEPSAGEGALVAAALKREAIVFAIEMDGRLIHKLADIPDAGDRLTIWQGDFIKWGPPLERYDRVMMNPPFSNNQDISHVRRAFEFLRPGGQLAAIMSPHYSFAEDRLSKSFRDWLRGDPVVEICRAIKLPERTFAQSGTGVRADMLLLRRAGG